MKKIFVYGTLKSRQVQKELFSKTLPMKKATLLNFSLFEAQDGIYFVKEEKGSKVEGQVIFLLKTDLKICDAFERCPTMYVRKKVKAQINDVNQNVDVYLRVDNVGEFKKVKNISKICKMSEQEFIDTEVKHFKEIEHPEFYFKTNILANMKKIVLIGCPGSGKTTLAIEIGKRLELPVVHLDKEFWQSGLVKPDRDEWNKKLVTLLEKPKWVMDGNFGKSIELRLQYADTLIYLDFNRFICRRRIKKRVKSYLGVVRPDMAEGCEERKDKEFLKFAWNFNRKNRKNYYTMFKKYPNKNIIILRSPKMVKKFLETI